jgi:hypothetical protein
MARRRPARRTNESLGTFVSLVGGASILAGFVPSLLHGSIGLALLALAVLFAVFSIVVDMQHGRSVAAALARVVAWGLMTVVAVYGCIWYVTVDLAARPDLFRLH